MSNDYVELMRLRNYEAIIRDWPSSNEPRREQQERNHQRELVSALMRTGHEFDAIPILERLIVLDGKWSSANDHNELGAIYWLQKQPSNAVNCWQKALKCAYGDSARNMTPALLLYYAAVRTHDGPLLQEASNLIDSKLRTGWSKNWPAPLGRYLIGVADENHVEEQLAKEHPERQPDERCRFDFYRGVKEFQKGNNGQALAWMRSAVDRRDQITWTTEFVLARHELGEIPNSDQ